MPGSSAHMVIAVFVCFWSVRGSVGSICMGLEDDLEDTMKHFLFFGRIGRNQEG